MSDDDETEAPWQPKSTAEHLDDIRRTEESALASIERSKLATEKRRAIQAVIDGLPTGDDNASLRQGAKK